MEILSDPDIRIMRLTEDLYCVVLEVGYSQSQKIPGTLTQPMIGTAQRFLVQRPYKCTYVCYHYLILANKPLGYNITAESIDMSSMLMTYQVCWNTFPMALAMI